MVNIIMPSSFFNKTSVDEDMQYEYDAILRVICYANPVILFEYDAWFNEHRLVLHLKEEIKAQIYGVYRGWMMHPALYRDFYYALLHNGIRLITNPDEYSLMHIFPNIYKYISMDTPKIITYPLYTDIQVLDISKRFTRFIVKDYVKSVKGTEFPDFFDASKLSQLEFDNWMRVFYHYRGDLLTGGICIKEYAELKKYHCGDIEFTNEFRVFYLFGDVLLISENSNQLYREQSMYNKVPLPLVLKYRNLGSPFYTIDFAEVSSGNWIVIEVGDGGVSGIPDTYNKDLFYKGLIEKCEEWFK